MSTKNIIKKVASLLTIISAITLTGCEERLPEEENSSWNPKDQYVAPGNVDVRGTWYDDGSNGGWWGPRNRWGFSWYYLAQFGTNIVGKFENELYSQNHGYDSLREITGSVKGDRIVINNSSENILAGQVRGEEFWYNQTFFSETSGNLLSYDSSIPLVRITPDLERRADPEPWFSVHEYEEN